MTAELKNRKFCAKLKTGEHTKIFETNEELENINYFIFPDVSNNKVYKTGGVACMPDEWDYVELNNEQKESMLREYLNSVEQTISLNPVTSENYKDIKNLYLIEGNKIIFSQITKKQIIRDQKVLNIKTGSVEVVDQDDAINFDGIVDSYFDGNNKIYFKSFSKAKSFFGKEFLTSFYTMVSEEESVDFFEGNDFFTTEEDINKINICPRNRTLISYIKDKGIDFTNTDVRKKYTDYASNYPSFGVNIDNGKFKFEKASDITNILHVLEERIYKTEVSGEERIARDIEKIS